MVCCCPCLYLTLTKSAVSLLFFSSHRHERIENLREQRPVRIRWRWSVCRPPINSIRLWTRVHYHSVFTDFLPNYTAWSQRHQTVRELLLYSCERGWVPSQSISVSVTSSSSYSSREVKLRQHEHESDSNTFCGIVQAVSWNVCSVVCVEQLTEEGSGGARRSCNAVDSCGE